MRSAILCLAIMASGLVLATEHKLTPAQQKIADKMKERVSAECAKKGQVALEQIVKGTVMFKCVAADDPAYKAQQDEAAARAASAK